MSDPNYYVWGAGPEDDGTWLGQLSVALIAATAGLAKIPGEKATVNFVVGAFVSERATAVAEDIALELECINEAEIKIDGVTYAIDSLADSALTSAITVGIVGLASAAMA